MVLIVKGKNKITYFYPPLNRDWRLTQEPAPTKPLIKWTYIMVATSFFLLSLSGFLAGSSKIAEGMNELAHTCAEQLLRMNSLLD
jgi:hypothetical protein